MPQATEQAQNDSDQRLAALGSAIIHGDARESFASGGSALPGYFLVLKTSK
jgi:hypothetical protein